MLDTLIALLPLLIVAAGFCVLLYFFMHQPRTAVSGTIAVRCQMGHLFTTVWIPFISFKAIRLGPIRLQYCPVGEHWTLVTPVDRSTLSKAERASADSMHDSLVP